MKCISNFYWLHFLPIPGISWLDSIYYLIFNYLQQLVFALQDKPFWPLVGHRKHEIKNEAIFNYYQQCSKFFSNNNQ